MNSVVLVGRLTRNPEVREASNGSKVATFTLAVRRTNDETDFFNCSTFSNNAEKVDRYVNKGMMVGVKGRLQNNTFKDKEGNNRTIIEVIVENIQIIGGIRALPKSEEKGFPDTTSIKQEEIVIDDSDLPF